jgi:hypothetical protein
MEMLDKRKITAATAVIGALALPATATATDATDGYAGLGAGGGDPRPEAVDGYVGLSANGGDDGTSYARPEAVDGYVGLNPKAGENPTQSGGLADTRVTPVVHMIDASDDEFDWNAAGIGAAGGLGVIAIAGGVAVVATGRRRSARRVASIG